MQKIYFLLVFAGWVILLSGGCRNSNTSSSGKEEVAVKNLVIPLNENYLQSYFGSYNIPVHFEKDGKEFMAAFNEKLNSCDVFNLTDKKIAYQIVLEKEGPDRVGVPKGMQYYKGNFLFEAPDSYRLVDSLGHLLLSRPKEPLNNLCQGYFSFKPHQILFMMYKFFAFDRESGTIAVTYYPPEINATPLTHPILIGLLELETGKVEKIEIPYPDIFSKQDKWGIMNDLNVCFNKDKLILNFAGSSNVYVYDRATEKLDTHSIPSDYVDNLIVPKPTELGDANDASINAGYYFPLQYDSYRDVYWRLQSGPVRERGAHK